MTVRFALGGSFASHPDLTAQLRRLYTDMPGLFNKLLPRSARLEHDDMNESTTGIQSDPAHLQAAAQVKIQATHCREVLGLAITGAAMSPEFRSEMSRAYRESYNLTVGSGAMGTRPIRWFKKISFTDPSVMINHW